MSWRFSLGLWVVLGAFALAASAARAQVTCGAGVADVTLPSGASVLNTYVPGPQVSGLVSVARGATRIPVDGSGVRGAAPIAAGDLVLVIQMQGAVIDLSGRARLDESFTAGSHELAIAAGPIAGGLLTVRSPLEHAYAHASVIVAGLGMRRYQVVRVAVARDLSIPVGSMLTALPWDGRSGGIVALDVSGELAVAGTIEASGMGFRGGSPEIPTARDSAHVSAVRGEGFAGRPGRVYGLPVSSGDRLTVVTGLTGLFGGDTGPGAPGSGGGCPATLVNDAGGGGGGGGGEGGIGRIVGGTPEVVPRGGAGIHDPNRLLLGGGGGSGSLDDPTDLDGVSGQPGGGIIYVRAASVTGVGSMDASGRSGVRAIRSEGGGGGGGGGSIFVLASAAELDRITLRARGGDGTGTEEPEDGGGGGGGGGHVVVATPTEPRSVAVDVGGGLGGAMPWAPSGSSGPGQAGAYETVLPSLMARCPAEAEGPTVYAVTEPPVEALELAPPAPSAETRPTADATDPGGGLCSTARGRVGATGVGWVLFAVSCALLCRRNR